MNQNDYIGKTLKPWPILVDHYTAVSLANEISKHRDRFIAGLIEDQDSSDAANDDSGRARTSAGVG